MGYVSDWVQERPGTTGGDDAIRERSEREKMFPCRPSSSEAGPFGCLIILVATIIFIVAGLKSQEVPDPDQPTLIEEITVNGFDPDGEPVIKKWSNGSLWIQFEAMPPFFAKDEGTENDFEEFETKIQDSLGVTVHRDDREVFVIKRPKPDTAEKVKAWLEAYRKSRS